MAEQQRPAGVLYRSGAVQHQIAEDDPRRRLAWQEEAAGALARWAKRLQTLLRPWDVGDNEPAVRRDVEAGRLNDAPFFLSDVDRFPRRPSLRVDGVHRVAAPVEYVIRPVRRLLKIDRFFVGADDVRRKTADRAQHIDAERIDRTCREERGSECQKYYSEPAASGLSALNRDQIAERGTRMARRDDREYREYLREEQRRPRGCIAGRMQLAFHHGLPGGGATA